MRSRRFWQLALLLVLLLVLMAGCAGGGSRAALTGSSWPGISVSDDVIYVAFGQQVYAIDPANTEEALWAFPSSPGKRQTFYAPPAIDGDLLIVADYIDSLFAVDAETGEQLWTYESERSRFIGGAAISEDYVYAGTVDGVLHALDRDDGTLAWTFRAERDIWATPLLVNGTVYITSLDRHLYALDASTGNLLWKFPETDGDEGDITIGAIVSTPTFYNGSLIFGSLNNRVYSLDAETQRIQWTYDTENWLWSSPAADEETNLLVGGDLNGHIFALDAESGRPVWTFEADGPVVGLPAISELSGERIAYITSGDSNLYALRLSDGTEAFPPTSMQAPFTTRFLIVPTGTDVRPVPVYAPPILYKDLVLLGVHQGDFPLIAVDQETLDEAWAFAPTGAERGAGDEGEEQEPRSPFNSVLNLLLPVVIAMLLVSMLNRNRQQAGK